MSAELVFWTFAVLLVLANSAAWFATLFMLPGNWVMLLLTGLFAYFYPDEGGRGVGWMAVVVIAGLTVLGEVVEFAAGAAGVAKEGGSRRGMALSIVGSVAGSIIGAIAGLPIPIIGSIVAAVGGGALGAFVGAYLGETWKGKTSSESISVGGAALVGRLLGTMSKLIVGAIIVVVSAVAVVV